MEVRNKIYLVFTFSAPAALFLTWFFIYPIFMDIKNSSLQILSDRRRMIALEVEARSLNNFKKNYKQYQPNFKKIDQLFINPQNPVEFVKFLEESAAQSSLQTNISLVPGAEKGKASFNIFTKGTFLAITMFTRKIDTGPYLITIHNLSIKKQKEKKETGVVPPQLEANFLIETPIQ